MITRKATPTESWGTWMKKPSGARAEPDSPGASAERSNRPKKANVAQIRRVAAAAPKGIAKYSQQIINSVRDARVASPEIRPSVDLKEFQSSPLAACWIGHATVLLRVQGMTILTDPVFSHRIGVRVPGMTIGVSRVAPPALDIEHLPEIDLVLLSHAHYDHLDRPSLQRLAKGPGSKATVITAARTRRLIPKAFGNVVELEWERRFEFGHAAIQAMRPNHWGARAAVDRARGFNAYLIEARGRRVLFAGDSAMTTAFDQVGPTDLAIYGIGAYDPWIDQHATPEQVWSMFVKQSGGEPRGRLLPMHHSTFPLGQEPLTEPLERLRRAAENHQVLIDAPAPGIFWNATDAS